MHGVPRGLCLLWRHLVGGVPFELCVAEAEQLVAGVHVRAGLVPPVPLSATFSFHARTS